MWLPIVGLLLGIAIGLVFSLPLPASQARLAAMAILAALDSVLGGVRAELRGEFENGVFLSGLATSVLLALGLTVLGDHLDVELYYAPIAAFGVRIFRNLAGICQSAL